MSDPKYISRFPPCPLYDVEGIESWLEDLAKQGLILTKGGLFCGFAEFVKAEPKPMRYRLQPLPKKKFMEDPGPTDAAVELAEEYGWTYLCNMGEFSVFGCENPNARELDTDPQVQAILYRQMYKKKRNSIISHCVLFLLLVALLGWYGFLTFFLENPRWYTSLIALVWLCYPFVAWQEMKQLGALKEKLSLGEPLSRRKDWKRNRHLHWISAILTVMLTLSFYAVVILENFIDWEDGHWQPIAEYTDDLPFPTMEELAGGGTLDSRTWRVDNNNEIAVRSTLLAAKQIRFEQFGDIKLDGEKLLDGALRVDYYDLRTEGLAKALFREIHHVATLSKGKYRQYTPLDCPELPTDQEVAFSTYEPCLLLRNGTEVLLVDFTQFDQKIALPLEQWATAVAEAFTE